jgi:hypothetical protein
MSRVVATRYDIFVAAERRDDSFVFLSTFALFRASGCAIRMLGDEGFEKRVQFFVGTSPYPTLHPLPISPFLAAHDLMRKTGTFPDPNFVFKPITAGMQLSAAIKDAPEHTEVIFWGKVVEDA